MRSKERNLVQSYTQVTQNNKCPHGFPLGSCPICSGMGSRPSSDRNKARKPGEMTYNECLAQWNLMKAQKQERLEQHKEFLAQLFQNPIKEKINSLINKTGIFLNNVINNSPKIIKTPLNLISNITAKTFSTISQIASNTFTIIKNITADTFSFISSTTEKLSSFIGEIKNFIKETISKISKENIFKTIKTVLELFTQSNKEENKHRKKVKFEKIKKTLRKIFKSRKEKQESEDL